MYSCLQKPLFLRPKSKEAAQWNGRLQRLLSVDFSLPKNNEKVPLDPHCVNAAGAFCETYFSQYEVPYAQIYEAT